MKGLIGKKLGMTFDIEDDNGKATPVTVLIDLGPCVVVQRRIKIVMVIQQSS